jgi:hypothetical protein
MSFFVTSKTFVTTATHYFFFTPHTPRNDIYLDLNIQLLTNPRLLTASTVNKLRSNISVEYSATQITTPKWYKVWFNSNTDRFIIIYSTDHSQNQHQIVFVDNQPSTQCCQMIQWEHSQLVSSNFFRLYWNWCSGYCFIDYGIYAQTQIIAFNCIVIIKVKEKSFNFWRKGNYLVKGNWFLLKIIKNSLKN